MAKNLNFRNMLSNDGVSPSLLDPIISRAVSDIMNTISDAKHALTNEVSGLIEEGMPRELASDILALAIAEMLREVKRLAK